MVGVEGRRCGGVVRMFVRLRIGVLSVMAMPSLVELSRFRRAIVTIGATSVRADASSSSVHLWGSSSVRTSASTFESEYLLLCVATYTPRRSKWARSLALVSALILLKSSAVKPSNSSRNTVHSK